MPGLNSYIIRVSNPYNRKGPGPFKFPVFAWHRFGHATHSSRPLPSVTHVIVCSEFNSAPPYYPKLESQLFLFQVRLDFEYLNGDIFFEFGVHVLVLSYIQWIEMMFVHCSFKLYRTEKLIEQKYLQGGILIGGLYVLAKDSDSVCSAFVRRSCAHLVSNSTFTISFSCGGNLDPIGVSWYQGRIQAFVFRTGPTSWDYIKIEVTECFF